MPYSLLDALALGKPVVGTELRVLRDTIGDVDKELLFPIGDVAALSKIMLKLAGLKPERRRDLADRSRAVVVAKHDIEKEWAERHVALYAALGRT